MPSEKAQQAYRKMLSRYAPSAVHEQYSYVNVLKEQLRPGMRWLDAGCGHNVIAPWLKEATATESELLSRADMVVGCDVDAVSLRKDSAIRRVACNLEQLAFATNTFDLISCNMVVEHLQDPGRVFGEFFRVLKPGGTAVIMTPNVLHWTMMLSHLTPQWFHVIMRKKLFGSDEDDVFPTVYRANTPSTLERKLREAGFNSVNVRLLASVPHLIGMGPLLYFEFLLHRLTVSMPKFREILCAVARKDN
jgi:ubiquinone/menaquinone biosynthesis C-methylase UbiE